jgi:membrane protein DedA with SNARE-associated domain
VTRPAILFGLAAGTLVSEDLTSISAGLLARDGVIDFSGAVTASAAGVYLGDLGLWAAGRLFGRRLLQYRWVASRFDSASLNSLGERIDTNLGMAILVSRFLPGSRLPMYLAVGIFGRRPLAFAAWSLLAVLLWTPLLVWATYAFGASVTGPLLGELSDAGRHLLSAAILFTLWKLTARLIMNLGDPRAGQ